jgi:putative FmdB family regulatory protein
MPTYDYICTSCNNAWELEQRIVEDAVKVCPKCGASTAKRQISAGAGFILKGGGWYADGYGPTKAAPASSGDEGSGGKGG